MANHKLASVIAEQLRNVDRRNPQTDEDIKTCNQMKSELFDYAKKRGLKMVRVPVSDGESFYWEVKRTKTMATFWWLYGGADSYISPWGQIVSVPVAEADRMIKKSF